ncbi:hypothetical protein E2C01_090088 [Portunus trituberculatus]|uniref:Uncharacterized protein n=1 Tax=Portunus trituberculatus TaxID=210409 RepID=A0A5B7JP77_PORTR|nr:hypothetical protein [Portunus trituberculatus]
MNILRFLVSCCRQFPLSFHLGTEQDDHVRLEILPLPGSSFYPKPLPIQEGLFSSTWKHPLLTEVHTSISAKQYK